VKTIRTKFLAAAALAATLVASPAFAQAPAMASADRAMQIAQAREANAALMHQYNWNSRVEIIVNGQVKDTRIEQVSYGMDGQLQHVLLNDQKSSRPFGPLRRAIAENEAKQLEEFLTGLKGLLEQYTLPTAGKILDFMTTARPSGPDPQGLFLMSGNNVVLPGDSMTIWVNPWIRHTVRLQVNTTYQGAPAQLTANFAIVPGAANGGLNHVAFAEITVPSKNVVVQTQNYNYYRLY
jgi:hypothetical protein